MGLISKLKPNETIQFKEGTLYLAGPDIADKLEFGMKPEVSYPYIFIYFAYPDDLRKIEQLPESSEFISLGGDAEARKHQGGFQIRTAGPLHTKIFSLATFSKEEYKTIKKFILR
jgi:hypothetical protein